MNKKILTCAFTVTLALSSAFALSACDGEKTPPVSVHEHTLNTVAAKAPACEQAGNKSYYSCDGCEKIFSDASGVTEISKEDTVILATGHSYESKYDSDFHWKECSCGAIADKEEHEYIDGICLDCESSDTEFFLTFTLSEDGTSYSVTGAGVKEKQKIIIPKTHNGLPVTAIGDYAFYEYTNLQNIIIPESITSIGSSAFSGTGITEIKLPDSINYIGAGAFSKCGSLTEIDIPDGVARIEFMTFNECTNLKTVKIGKGVNYIEQDPFAFSSCFNIETFSVSDENTVYSSKGGCLIETATKTLIAGGSKSVIPSDGSVTKIEKSAFVGKDLTEFEIPLGVTHIGQDAFSGCNSLKRVIIGDSVTDISSYAFSYCTNLENVHLGKSVNNLTADAFAYCENLSSFTVSDENEKFRALGGALINPADKALIIGCKDGFIPADGSVNKIENSAFLGRGGFRKIVIPECINYIGDVAFASCPDLEEVVIGANTEFIGFEAFWLCPVLEKVSFVAPDGWFEEAYPEDTNKKSIDLTDPVKNAEYLSDFDVYGYLIKP